MAGLPVRSTQTGLPVDRQAGRGCAAVLPPAPDARSGTADNAAVARIAAIGFDPVGGLLRHQRRRHHHAINLQLRQATGDDEPAWPGEKPRGGLAALRGLLDEVQDDVFAAEFAGEFFQRVQVVGDRAVEADFTVGPVVGDGDPEEGRGPHGAFSSWF
jgi:hypothetical protein